MDVESFRVVWAMLSFGAWLCSLVIIVVMVGFLLESVLNVVTAVGASIVVVIAVVGKVGCVSNFIAVSIVLVVVVGVAIVIVVMTFVVWFIVLCAEGSVWRTTTETSSGGGSIVDL